MKLRQLIVLVAMLATFPGLAQAWWNEDWTLRQKITLNTTPAGAATTEALVDLPVLLRLHTGNYTFPDGKPDGSDLRFVAQDDKTPLKYQVESFDSTNELALVWVRVPNLGPNSNAQFIYLYYGNQKAVAESDARGTHEPATLLALHFAEKQGAPQDSSSYAHPVGESTATSAANGLSGAGVSFNGSAQINIPAAPTLKAGSAGLTVSLWVKPAEAGKGAPLLVFPADGSGLWVGLDGAKVSVRVPGAQVQGTTDLAPSSWHAVSVVLGQKLIVYVDGKQEAEAPSVLPALTGPLAIGGPGFKGDMDEVVVAGTARSPDWIKAGYAGLVSETKLAAIGETEQNGGGKSYFTILLKSVTIDGWVVIGILMVMMVVSFVVMITKARFVIQVDGSNRRFLKHFKGHLDEMLDPTKVPSQSPKQFRASNLHGMWRVALDEIATRFSAQDSKSQARGLSPQALNAIKAVLDATSVRENARLNSQMVLLTIAISGGPFLGLLGTVVGVMITFAAIAAAGDVNVNSIAPGIAAALVATVAGLGVAIPSLFGYNYLASRIKGISNDMAVFSDELVSRLAETYSA